MIAEYHRFCQAGAQISGSRLAACYEAVWIWMLPPSSG
jgi:hypothetical protein